MKIALFEGLLSGSAVRIFCGQPADAEAMIADPMFAGCALRVLDGTPFAEAMSLAALPGLTDFDAATQA